MKRVHHSEQCEEHRGIHLEYERGIAATVIGVADYFNAFTDYCSPGAVNRPGDGRDTGDRAGIIGDGEGSDRASTAREEKN